MAHQVTTITSQPHTRQESANRGIRHDDMKELRCMSFTSKGTAEIIVAGLQDIMLVIDLNKGEVVKQVCWWLLGPMLFRATDNAARSQPNTSTPS